MGFTKLVSMNARIANLKPETELQHVAPALLGHYPTGLIDVRVLRSGARLTLRPVLPQDAGPLAELINRLSEKSRRQRFPNARQPASPEELAALTCVDYRQHLALVIETRIDGQLRLVAEARYLIDDGGHAEVAMVVDDAWQRSGIGTWVTFALSLAAFDAGVGWLRGDVLAGNKPMLALMRRCGFCCTVNRGDPGIVHVETRPRVLNARRTASARRPFKWVERVLGGTRPATTQYKRHTQY